MMQLQLLLHLLLLSVPVVLHMKHVPRPRYPNQLGSLLTYNTERLFLCSTALLRIMKIRALVADPNECCMKIPCGRAPQHQPLAADRWGWVAAGEAGAAACW